MRGGYDIRDLGSKKLLYTKKKKEKEEKRGSCALLLARSTLSVNRITVSNRLAPKLALFMSSDCHSVSARSKSRSLQLKSIKYRSS